MHEQYKTSIASVVAERWAAATTAGSNIQTKVDPDGPFRASVARELFAGLPEEERLGYAARAKADAKTAREKYEVDLKQAPSKSPEARHE